MTTIPQNGSDFGQGRSPDSVSSRSGIRRGASAALIALAVAGGLVSAVDGHAVAGEGGTLIYSQQFGDQMELFLHVLGGAHGRVELPDNDTSPSWAPNGGAIVFTSDRGQRAMGSDGREIYLVSGAETRRLTNNASFDEHPDFSPTGERIAYTSTDHEGRWQISTMTPRGTLKRTLTSGASNWEPSYSPDGRKIAFVSNRDGGVAIYEMNADGSDEHEVYRSGNVVASPSYSPDSARILFTEETNGQTDVYWYTLGAGVKTAVTNTPAFHESAPRYSPDGRRIAFAGRAGADRPAIFIMDYNGRNREQVSDAGSYANWPDWVAPGPAQEPAPQVPIPPAMDAMAPTIKMIGKPKKGRTYLVKKIKRFKGRATDVSGVAKVELSVKMKASGKCRHLRGNGKLSKRQSCAKRYTVVANGGGVFAKRVEKLRKGRYVVSVRATDTSGNTATKRYRFRLR